MHLQNYRVYTSVLHTKRLVHFSFNWWATHAHLQVWIEITSSLDILCIILQMTVFGCVTSLISLHGLKLSCSCTWHFRLAACVPCLTMLQQYAAFGCWPQEQACMRHQKINVVYSWSNCVKLSHCHHSPCFHSLWRSLPEADKKWIKLDRVKTICVKVIYRKTFYTSTHTIKLENLAGIIFGELFL